MEKLSEAICNKLILCSKVINKTWPYIFKQLHYNYFDIDWSCNTSKKKANKKYVKNNE